MSSLHVFMAFTERFDELINISDYFESEKCDLIYLVLHFSAFLNKMMFSSIIIFFSTQVSSTPLPLFVLSPFVYVYNVSLFYNFVAISILVICSIVYSRKINV